MSFLKEITAAARARLRDLPSGQPAVGEAGRFEAALRGRGRLSVVAEVKRKSPSRGELASKAEALSQARCYCAGGAQAISVLTEPTQFGGDLEDLRRVARGVPSPVLMKDFLIDPEQVRAGALLGASAVLLILRMLEGDLLGEMWAACAEFHVDALVECHTRSEIERAATLGARIIGVNNRDLDTLSLDTARALALLPLVPAGAVAIAESGYLQPADTHPLHGRCDAVLIGSALMTSDDPEAFLAEVSR